MSGQIINYNPLDAIIKPSTMTRIISAQTNLYCSLEREKRTKYKMIDYLDYGYVSMMYTNEECKISGKMERMICQIVRWQVN